MSSVRTKYNIARHELIGLDVAVMRSRNKSQVGLKGKIVDETAKTIIIGLNGSAEKSKRRVIPKAGTIFRVALDKGKVDIDGDIILGRPEDRIKKKLKRW